MIPMRSLGTANLPLSLSGLIIPYFGPGWKTLSHSFSSACAGMAISAQNG
jgi:hypothetical protein